MLWLYAGHTMDEMEWMHVLMWEEMKEEAKQMK